MQLNKYNFLCSIKNLYLYIVIFFPFCFFFGNFIINSTILIICIIFLSSLIKYKNNYECPEYLKFLFFFIFYIFINQLFIQSFNIEKIIKVFLQFRFLILFVVIYFFFQIIEEKKLIKIKKYFFFIFLFIICDLIFQYFNDRNILNFKGGLCYITEDKSSFSIELCSRYAGFFNQNLVMGSYIASIIFIHSFILIKFKKGFFFKLFPIFLIVPIILTGDRTPLIFYLVLLNFYFLYLSKFKINLKFVSLFLGIILSTILIFNFLPKKTTSRTIDETLSIFFHDGKLNIQKFNNSPWLLHYRSGILIFKEKPIFGNGYKSFRTECYKYSDINKNDNLREKKMQVCSTHPHNFFLEILMDFGLMGLILFLLFIYKFLIKIYNFSRNNHDYKLIFYYLVLFVLMPKPTGSIFGTFFSSYFWYILAYASGYILYYKKNLTIN